MDNAQKAIMVGVGLFITIIVIAAVMLITGMGQDMITSGQEQVSNISTSLQAQLTSEYDGTTLTGSQVIAAVKRYYTHDSMVIRVQVKSGGNYSKDSYTYTEMDVAMKVFCEATTIGTTASYGKTRCKIGDLTDITNQNTYVPTSARFTANLIKLQSGAVVGIFFKMI